MEYIAVLNNYPQYSLHDNLTVNLSFLSISMHVFHAHSVHKNAVVLHFESYWLTPRLKMIFSVFSSVPSFL